LFMEKGTCPLNCSLRRVLLKRDPLIC
jgi:hypothetical protein